MGYENLEDEDIIRLAVEAQATNTAVHPYIMERLDAIGMTDIVIIKESNNG